MAITFLQEVIPADTYEERCWQLLQGGPVEVGYSHDESLAFRSWSDAQFTQAKAHFLEQRDDPQRGVLDYRDETGRVISQRAIRSDRDG
jgi:hypothetical protein